MTQVSKKIPSVLLAALIAVAAAFAIGTVTAQKVHAMDGNGTQENPYKISSYADLEEFAVIVNGTNEQEGNSGACAVLENSFDCGNEDWTPIGKDKTHQFLGRFNGNHNVISGLSNGPSSSEADYQGLFGYVGSGGVVENVGLEGGKIEGDGYVGGVAGYNYQGTITNCYNTGEISGESAVGGVVGYIFAETGPNYDSTVTNCYNTGAVSAFTEVGGVVGYNNEGTITNCYNTGAVSGTGNYVGGVIGLNQVGTVTNCYNTGAVNGSEDVGGVNGQNGDTITNCYNIGVVSGNKNVGGVAGSNFLKISNCWYDRSLGLADEAIGTGTISDTVRGLVTSEMTGTNALSNMGFSTDAESPWLVKANGQETGDAPYYQFYPHLKGFAYDISSPAADWPAKAIFDVDWKGSDSYTYKASAQKPAVSRITISQKPVDPEGKTAKYSMRTDEGWSELATVPTDPGTYRMTIKDGDDVIDEIVFFILDPPDDYTVDYYKQTGDDSGSGEPIWSTDSIEPVNVGTYKAEVTVTRTGGTVLPEKVFQIKKAPLTITAQDQTYVYNGNEQGEGDPAYDDPAVIAKKVSASGLKGNDVLTSLIMTGTAKEIGEYPGVIQVTGVTVGSATDSYDITYVDGKLTITPIPLTVTINGSAAKKTYNGKQQTYTGKVTATSKDKAFDASRFRYTGSTVVKGTKAGTYTKKLIAGSCAYSDPHYELKVTIGSPVKLTITGGQTKPAAKAGGTPMTTMTSKGNHSLAITWVKVKGAAGYEIYFARCDGKGKATTKKVKTIKGNKTFTWTKSGLKKKTAYKAYVKAYAKKNGKKKYIGSSPIMHAYTSGATKQYTNAKAVTVNKTKVKLKKGKTFKIKTKVKKLKKNRKLMPSKHVTTVRYLSTDKKIAAVTKKGKIIAKGKGTCYVYIYAHNGVFKKVKVTVK